MARTLGQKAARQPSGAGADFQHIKAFQITCLPCDLGRQVQIQKKVLPQRFPRTQIMRGDDLAQRRKRVDAHPARAAAMRAAIFSASIRDVGLAMPRPAMSNAVP